jgi:flagellar protein FlaG
MIIQITNNNKQAEQTVSRISDDAPKAVANNSNAKPPLGGADRARQPSSEQLKKAADNINQAMQQSNQNLEFEFTMDTDTKKAVVRVVDTKTGELIRQIPSEETLAIARSIDQFRHGLLLSQKA